MNKIKMFFAATALLLITAGVFAGYRQTVTGQLFAVDQSNPGTARDYPLIQSSVNLSNLVVNTTSPLTFTPSVGTDTYYLAYYKTGTGYIGLATTF